MRAIFALAVAAVLALAAAPAYADVSYNFIPTSAQEDSGQYGSWVTIPTDGVPLQTLVFSDAAVEAGSAGWGNLYVYMDASSGLVGGQVGIYPQSICTVQPDYPTCWVQGTFNLTFNANGTLSGGMYDLSSGPIGAWGEISGGGSDKNWTITIAQDGVPVEIKTDGYWFAPPQDLPHPCCGHGHGQGQGHDPDPADPVPEPSSAAIILAAIGMMVGLGLRRKLPA